MFGLNFTRNNHFNANESISGRILNNYRTETVTIEETIFHVSRYDIHVTS